MEKKEAEKAAVKDQLDIPTRLRELVKEMRSLAEILKSQEYMIENESLLKWSGFIENYALGIECDNELEKEG